MKDNTTYYYRLKAFGDKTESDMAVAQANTAQILALEEDLTNIFTIYPNPAEYRNPSKIHKTKHW
ncbi:MAG: hypothetical protein U5N85_01285 [Arcicella sp.]|nr:hypothetical protein [Arcicella sp.]